MTPNLRFKVKVYLTAEYLENGATDPLNVWFDTRVFGIGGSNYAISGLIICKMAADSHLGMTVRNLCVSWAFLLIWSCMVKTRQIYEERVIEGSLNRDQVTEISKLSGCENFVYVRDISLHSIHSSGCLYVVTGGLIKCM